MLGYVINPKSAEADGFLEQVAQALLARGLTIAGAIQSNYEFDPERRCHMDLRVLGSDRVIRISQDRGRHARGCRLDSEGLALAAGQVEAMLDREPVSLLIVNKFGKSELDGQGFRHVIGKALTAGIPVLTTLSAGVREGFLEFAGDIAVELPRDPHLVQDWCSGRAVVSI